MRADIPAVQPWGYWISYFVGVAVVWALAARIWAPLLRIVRGVPGRRRLLGRSGQHGLRRRADDPQGLWRGGRRAAFHAHRRPSARHHDAGDDPRRGAPGLSPADPPASRDAPDRGRDHCRIGLSAARGNCARSCLADRRSARQRGRALRAHRNGNRALPLRNRHGVEAAGPDLIPQTRDPPADRAAARPLRVRRCRRSGPASQCCSPRAHRASTRSCLPSVTAKAWRWRRAPCASRRFWRLARPSSGCGCSGSDRAESLSQIPASAARPPPTSPAPAILQASPRIGFLRVCRPAGPL